MGKKHIKLYVDLVSPFGYLGYWFVRNSPVFKSVEVEYVPILLGGLMKMCDNRPPLQIKNKDKWINRERRMWAKQFNIPMRDNPPPGFPVPTITAQRLLCALQLQSPTHLPSAIDQLYAAIWAPHTLPSSTPKPTDGQNYNINTPADLSLLLTPVLGEQPTKSLLAAIGTPEVKAALGKNTDAAFKDEAFGLPWFQCTNERGETEGFWAFDHMGQVVRFLGLDGEALGGAKGLRPLL